MRLLLGLVLVAACGARTPRPTPQVGNVAVSIPEPVGSGTIAGRITDVRTGETLVGVTVVADPVGRGGDHVAISDEDGYRVEVPSGRYRVHFYYADLHEGHRVVDVSARSTLVVHGRFAPGLWHP